jgi:LacI family transcriptional regulator
MSNPESKPQSVSMEDIARAAGISRGAVSLALRNRPGVSEATCKRVQALARKMGYEPNPMGVGLAHYKQKSMVQPVHAALAWLNVWPDKRMLRSYREFDRYWHGASQAAAKFGYRLEEFFVDDQMPPARLKKILLTRNIRGILIPPVDTVLDWTGFDWGQFSVVRFGRGTAGIPRFQTVSSAQAANAMLAFDKIKEKGYKRIGFVGHRTLRWTFVGGYLHAQAVHLPESSRLPPMLFEKEFPVATQFVNWDNKETLEHLVSWLERWKPDAILTEQAAVLPLLKKAGRRVPKDVGVAGLNVLDLPYDAGIYQNPEEIGRVATLVAISLLNDNDRGIPAIQREILVKGKWVDGASLPQRS